MGILKNEGFERKGSLLICNDVNCFGSEDDMTQRVRFGMN